MKSTTKAQIEIVGLAIIAVIVVVLVLFLSLKSSNSGMQDKQQTLLTQTAQSFLESIVHKKTECGPALGNIIKNCYGFGDNCGGSCEYAKTVLKDNLESHFGAKNTPYSLTVEKDGIKKLEINSADGACANSAERAGSGILALPNFPGLIIVELNLC